MDYIPLQLRARRWQSLYVSRVRIDHDIYLVVFNVYEFVDDGGERFSKGKSADRRGT